jgi:hypothetical protein
VLDSSPELFFGGLFVGLLDLFGFLSFVVGVPDEL